MCNVDLEVTASGHVALSVARFAFVQYIEFLSCSLARAIVYEVWHHLWRLRRHVTREHKASIQSDVLFKLYYTLLFKLYCDLFCLIRHYYDVIIEVVHPALGTRQMALSKKIVLDLLS